jgi:quinol-cytochrome oxidoreductase complex cytochrome b subunit
VLSLYSSKCPFTKRMTKLYNTNSVSKAISILLYKTQVLNYLDFPTADSPRSIYIFLLAIVIHSQLSLCVYIPKRTSLNWYVFPCVGVCLVDILYIYYSLLWKKNKRKKKRKEKKKKQTEIVVIAYTWY